MPPVRIGIFGGSFNPLHHAHLGLAEYAFSELNLDRLIFVPSFQSPLKEQHRFLCPETRLKRVKKAIEQYPCFEVSDIEIRRGGLSYTVDTLVHFKKKFGKDATLFFITGADILPELSRWKNIRKIFTICRFVVASRAGYERIPTPYPVIWLNWERRRVSSTELRQGGTKNFKHTAKS